ncbi:MAG: hypothetical protein WCO58_02160 [bacterium]
MQKNKVGILLLLEDEPFPSQWEEKLTGEFNMLLFDLYTAGFITYVPKMLYEKITNEIIKSSIISLEQFYDNKQTLLCRKIDHHLLWMAINHESDATQKLVLDKMKLPRIDFIVSYIKDGSDEFIIRNAEHSNKKVFHWYNQQEIEHFIIESHEEKFRRLEERMSRYLSVDHRSPEEKEWLEKFNEVFGSLFHQ